MGSSHLLPIQHLHSSQRLRKDDRDLDVDEEHWFNDDADENKLTSLSHGTIFNGGAGSDDEDSQTELTGTTTSAISSNDEPSRPPPLHQRTDHDDETETTSSQRDFLLLTLLLIFPFSFDPNASSQTDDQYSNSTFTLYNRCFTIDEQ